VSEQFENAEFFVVDRIRMIGKRGSSNERSGSASGVDVATRP
jgi:hypothetical protein